MRRLTAADATDSSDVPDLGALVRSPQVAARAFGLYVIIGWFLAMFRYGPRRWFYLDDWWVLAGRDGGSIHSIFQPHNEHLIAFGVVVYRVLFNVFGLVYPPFLLVVVTMHIALVCVVRAVMRHIGVAPWTATLMAGTLVLFGPGEENIVWSFQVSWIAALLFSLLQLLLADHPGPIGRRDVAGAVLGVVAMCSSSIAAFVIVATALVLLVRRGIRAAVFQVGPAAIVYLTWLVVVSPKSPAPPGPPTLRIRLRWAWEGLLAPFRDLTQRSTLATVLAALAMVGVLIGIRTEGRLWLRRHVLAISLLAMSPLMFVVISETRWRFSVGIARAPRYVYVAAVLVLPALAVAVDALARRARIAHLTALAIVAAGIPPNVRLMDHPSLDTDVYAAEERTILGLAHHPYLDAPPASARVSTGIFSSPFLTVGWLRETRDRGLAPDEIDLDRDHRLWNTLGLRLAVARTADPEPTATRCPNHDGPVDLELRSGDTLRFQTTAYAVVLEVGAVASDLVTYKPLPERDLVATVFVPSIAVRIVASQPGKPFRACLPR